MSKKPFVLGSSTFNFIANMASRTLNTRGDLDFSSDCSGTTDSEKEKKYISGNSEEETIDKPLQHVEINQTEFLVEFNTELSLKTGEKNLTDLRLLSKSEKEYKINSTLGQENFLKGCKW